MQKCNKCHKTFELLEFVRNDKEFKTCNTCSRKRKETYEKKEIRKFKQCNKCHKKFYNLEGKFDPFLRHNRHYQKCNVCYLKEHLTEDFELKSDEEIKHESERFKMVHEHFKWFVNLKNDRVWELPYPDKRADVPLEERKHGNVVSFHRVFNRGEKNLSAHDYYTWSQLPNLFW